MDLARSLLLLLIFIAAAVSVALRPHRVSGGWWAILAAAICLGLGLVTLEQAAVGLARSWNVILFFGGLLLMALVLERAGAMVRLLDRMEAWAGGSPGRLLALVIAAAVVITVLFSNDATAILYAPEVIRLFRLRGWPVASAVVAIAITANAASLVLPISNPVNLLILERSQISLGTFAARLTPPALVGVLVAVLATYLIVRRAFPSAPAADGLPGRGAQKREPASGAGLLWALAALLGLLVLADGYAVAVGIPIGVATLAAGCLALLMLLATRGPAAIEILPSVQWEVLAMVAGFTVIASGLERSHLLALAASDALGAASGRPQALLVGGVSAALAAAINNIPSSLLLQSALAAAHRATVSLLLPLIAGSDLGPNLVPLGSLSTLLILSAARSQGEVVPWRRLFGAGALVGLLCLAPVLWLTAGNR